MWVTDLQSSSAATATRAGMVIAGTDFFFFFLFLFQSVWVFFCFFFKLIVNSKPQMYTLKA